jgi:polygalacturonase
MNKKTILISLLCMLMPLTAMAIDWDKQKYEQIEKSIRQPQICGKDYVITTFGAKASATAAHNQKAIQKAIDRCSRKGGGRVVVPAGETFVTGAIHL